MILTVVEAMSEIRQSSLSLSNRIDVDSEGMPVEVTTQRILEICCEYFGISEFLMKDKTRLRRIVVCRQIAMYVIMKQGAESLISVGRLFGGRDHSTVIHSIKTVKDIIEVDKSEFGNKVRRDIAILQDVIDIERKKV